MAVKERFQKPGLSIIGLIGTTIASLCCLGIPALISLLSAVGLGLILRDAILVPALMIFLFITLLGPYLSAVHHGKPWPLILGLLSAAIIVTFSRLIIYVPLAVVGLAGLVAATLFNIWLGSCRVQSSLDLGAECHPEKNSEKKIA